VSQSHLKAAEYFDGRAKRARSEQDRTRFLGVAKKYREMASENENKLIRGYGPQVPKARAPHK
jgi:hypothetical protein